MKDIKFNRKFISHLQYVTPLIHFSLCITFNYFPYTTLPSLHPPLAATPLQQLPCLNHHHSTFASPTLPTTNLSHHPELLREFAELGQKMKKSGQYSKVLRIRLNGAVNALHSPQFWWALLNFRLIFRIGGRSRLGCGASCPPLLTALPPLDVQFQTILWTTYIHTYI